MQINELLELKVIRDSTSRHTSPAFIINNHSEQKRGKSRLVINYKRLNDNTLDNRYKIPNKDELLKCIQNAKYFSKFDCESSFWQIRLWIVYIADVLAFSQNKFMHITRLHKIWDGFKNNNILISKKKIKILKQKIDFLGLTIDIGTIELQSHIVSKILEFPYKIKDTKELQKFLGLLNYSRKFIPILVH